MAIGLPGESVLPPGPKREFFVALHALYDLAGQPAARTVSREIYKRPDTEIESVSHETVSSILRGANIPAWGKVQSMVTVLARMSIRDVDLDASMTRIHELWLGARRPEQGDRGITREGGGADPQPVAAPVDGAVPWTAVQFLAGPAVEGRPAATAPPNQVVSSLPERNPDFTGREILLDTMRERHRDYPNAPLVLFGIGGVGKTQLAREYIHRYANNYSIVWWMSADSVEQARSSLVTLAERMDLPLRQNAEQTVAGVLGTFESGQHTCLLIFDGAEGGGIRRLIPTIGVNVIVTSRDPDWAHDSANSRLEVPDFDRAEAIQFLRKRDNVMTGQQATELIERLGRLPLALEHLAALRLVSGWPWGDLLRSLDDPDRTLLSTQGAEPAHYPHTVAASLKLALEQLKRANPVALVVFELFAWFGSEPVSVSLLRQGARVDVQPELRRALGDPIMLGRVVTDINRYGLGRLHTQDQRIEVQPLMRLVLRDLLTPEAAERSRRNVQEILTAADLGWPDDLGLWDLHRAMAPHVLPAMLMESRLSAAQRAVYHQIRYRYLLGEYEEACRLGEAAVTAWQEPGFLGADDKMVLLSTREWANALRALGRYDRSRELTAQAMSRLVRSKTYGEDHSYTLDMARSHAADLRIAGEYADAYELDEATYRRCVDSYPEGDDRTAASHHNLAVSLRLLGRFETAAEIDLNELNSRRARLGEDHRRTRLSLNALAEDLYGLGRYREVMALRSPSLEVGDRAVRPDELGLLLVGRTIGLAYRRLGQYGQSLDMLHAHYTECVASFGVDHGFSLAAMMSYANALRDRGVLGLAYSTAVDAIGGYERSFGPDNPLTLAAQLNLAVILRKRGERHQALRADEAACRSLRRVVGDAHPFTVVSMINLATDQARTGDANAALTTSRRASALALEVRGPRHFESLAAAANLTIDDEGEGASLDGVLADLRRMLGPEHPVVMDVAAGVRVDCDVEPPSL